MGADTGRHTNQRAGLITAAIIGAVAGGSLRAHRDRRGALGAARAGAALLTACGRPLQRPLRPGEIPPLWHRIVMSSALAFGLPFLTLRYRIRDADPA